MNDDLLAVFASVARRAGDHLRTMQPSATVVLRRDGGDLVLDADRRAQDLIVGELERAMPGVPIVAEESPPTGILPHTYLSVDPLDGTIPYSRGCAEWGVNIGFVVDGVPSHGTIFLPASDQLLTAHVAGSCELNGKAVFGQTPERGEPFVLGCDLHYATDPEFVRRVLPRLIPSLRLTRSLGSTAALTVDLAAGHTDAHLNQRGGGIWDIVTLGVVAASLGYRVTDLRGGPRDWTLPDTSIVVASSDEAQRLLLEAVGTV